MAVTYATTAGQIWGFWSANVTSGTITQAVWQTWAYESTASYTTSANVWDLWSQPYAVAYEQVLTEEQIEAARVAAEARAAQAAERAAEVEAAKARARQLLLDALVEEQRRELLERGYFHVETRGGTRRYRLSPTGQPKRVQGEDGVAWSYCIHPDYGYPQDDVVLAQKLLLEADEDEFLRIANARRVAA